MSISYYDYLEDEWYDEDEEPEISEWVQEMKLCRAPNGHLYLLETVGWCFEGQDWGETVGQWETTRYRLSEVHGWIGAAAIEQGRNLKPGEKVYFPVWDYEPDEEDEEIELPLPPKQHDYPLGSVDDIPF